MEEDYNVLFMTFDLTQPPPLSEVIIGKASTCSHTEKKDKERVKGRLPSPLCYCIFLD